MRFLFRARRLIRTLIVAGVLLLLFVLVARAVVLLSGWLEVGIVAAAVVLLLLLASWGRRWVPRRTILEIDFERGVLEHVPPGPFGSVGRRGPHALGDLLDVFERAGKDRRVLGVVARIGAFRPGLAIAEELRDAVLAFRAKGKWARAFVETLGEGASATAEYFLASAFDEIHLQPGGLVGVDGLMLRHPFLKDALAKIGVDPELGSRREYKTAKYLFTERSFNEPHREMMQSLLDDMVGAIVDGIASGRGMEPPEVRALLDRGPFTAKEALDARLVDHLTWRDQLYASLKEQHKARLLYAATYLRRAGRPHRKGHVVALIQATGSIHRGLAPPRGTSIGSDDVAKAFRRAARSKRVKAILFRVDSPGGSAVASETIWREVVRAREKKKAVVVSMGNVAGSGGYYVACGADRIVADASTLTGSIGVVWGKFVTREAWQKLGVTWDSLKAGENADLWSPAHEFGEKGLARLDGLLDRVYEDFKEKVAAGRHLSPERVEEVAKGRVWTGRRALALGLVDGVGGRGEALRAVREAAALPEEAPLRLRRYYPRRPGLRTAFGTEQSSDAAIAHVLGALARLDPAFEAAGPALAAPVGALRMPPLVF